MAATRLIAMHNQKGKTVAVSLQERLEYSMNPQKTEKGELITGFGCDPKTAKEEFMLSRRLYEHKTGRTRQNDVIAYQIRQSFKPGEITAEEANRVGMDLAKRFTKGRHAFIVATHVDRAHIHNHIIFNSISMDGLRKFENFRFSAIALQRLSDQICMENNLSVIQKGKPSEWSRRTEYPSRPRKPRTFKPKKVDFLMDIEEKLRTKGFGYARWATIFNTKQMANTLLLLREHKIESFEQLDGYVANKKAERSQLLNEIKESESRLQEIGEMRKQIVNYAKTRKIYEEYRNAGYSRRFFEEHREALEMHKHAKTAFDKYHGKKLPTVKELQAEYQRVLAQKRETLSSYKKTKDDVRELLVAQRNIRELYEDDKSREKKSETMRR